MSSTAPEITASASFEDRLDALHEMLYTRGGIRPVNAAIEELAKIVLLQLKHAHDPDWAPAGLGPLREILDPNVIRNGGDPVSVKRAFTEIIALPEFAAYVPGDDLQPIWPLDEPFRLQRADVLAAALEAIDPDMIRGMESRQDYDILGTAFDVLLRGRYDHSGGLATYLTPHSVATMLAEMCLADVDIAGDWEQGVPCFGDPCCGTGRFLVAGVREARRLAEEFGDDKRASRYLDAFAGTGLLAADQSSSSVAKARLNLLLFGIQQPRVFTVEDSITDSHLDHAIGKMRLILTNPPFGEGKYDSPEGIARTRESIKTLGKRPTIDPALAFVVRCLDLLGDGGLLGIVLPDGLVDGAALRGTLLGAADSPTRLRDVSIEANVSLPTATFALSGTVARTSTLVLRKGGARRNFIFLAKAEHVGYLKQAGVAVLDPDGDDLPKIAELGAGVWSAREEPKLKSGVLALSSSPSVSLVEANGVLTVDPARVDPKSLKARAEILKQGGQSLKAYLKPKQRKATPADDERPFISVLHVDHLGAVDWYEANTYKPTTPGKVVLRGELIISLLNPSKLRATVIPDDIEEAICSSEFGIFECSVEPYEILVLLNDSRVRDQLNPIGRGTSSSRRRIDNADVFSIVVPPITPEVKKRAATIRRAHDELRKAGLEAATTLFG